MSEIYRDNATSGVIAVDEAGRENDCSLYVYIGKWLIDRQPRVFHYTNEVPGRRPDSYILAQTFHAYSVIGTSFI